MDKNYQSDNIRGGGGSNHTTTTASTTTNTTNVHHRTTPIPTEMPPIQNIELGHNVGGGDNGEGVEDFATCEGGGNKKVHLKKVSKGGGEQRIKNIGGRKLWKN